MNMKSMKSRRRFDMKDCAIICGYPANEDGTISSILKSRIDLGIDLYMTHQVRYLIVSGGAIHNAYNEAEVMRDYATEKGVPKENILIENQAKSTYHNMLYSKKIMDTHHFHNCFVITNSWHMIKAKHYAKKFHLDYQTKSCHKPENMTYLHVWLLTLYMPINMFINRCKGFY